MANTLRKFQYILEGIDQEHLTDILVKRLKSRYPDISTKYEEDVLHDAAMDVASFHAGAEELGTSDIGAMIREVIKNLERFNERGQGEKMIPNSVRGWRMNEETEPERVVRQLKAAKKYLGQDPEPKKEPEEKETNESYWGGPSPAQLRFNRALKKQQNSPENKADREKFQKELDRIMPPPKKEPEDKEVTEGAAISTSGKTDSGYTWKFEAGREVPFKTDIDVNTFIRVTDPAGKTVAGVWADVAGDSLVVEYSQVFDEELRGKGLYTDLLKSLSKQYDVTSDTDTNNAAVSIYKRLGADYDARQEKHTLRKQGVAEGSDQNYLSQIPNLTWKPVSRSVWNTIQDEGLDEEQDAPNHTDWVMANLTISPKDSQALQAFDNDAIEDFNRFDIHLKSRYPGLTDLIDYDRGTVTIVKTVTEQGVAEGRKKKNKKTSRSLGRYFFPGYGYYGSGESGEGGGDGGGGESMAEGTNVDIGGIQLNVVADGAEVIIRPSVDGYQAGYAVFDRDGSTLVPADLAIDEEFRGQGIAKTIYDYVKSLGFTIRRSSDQTKAGKHFWDKNRGEDSQVWEQTMTLEELDEACWKGYHKEGMKTMFGKRYPNCVKNTNEDHQQCPECGGPMFSEEMINEKKDACYYKVKSRYKVWPSAYASGALVKCRKKGASNWGNSTKNESSILEGLEQTDENLHKWFKEKWVRFGPDGKIRGDCARGDDSEGKPKCLPQSKAQNLGKKGRASAAARKRREDPNPERSGKAINVATKKKTSESSILQGISETKGLPMPGSYEQENKPFLRKGEQKLMALTTEQEELDEKWSNKYKRSINCNNPKGFSQKAHCQGKKK